MIAKYMKKIRNRSSYLAHVVQNGGAVVSYDEFIRTAFDRRFGVETESWVLLEELKTASPNKELAGFYVPTDPGLFSRMVRASGVEPGRFTFVDLGCGKGRMLILAAELGFKKAVGVEFCPELSAQAKRNVEKYEAKFRRGAGLAVEHLDATLFEFPDEPLVIFFYNSFRGEALREVLGNLERSLRERPREVYFLWNGPGFFPELKELIEGCGALRVAVREEEFVILRG
jgi:SAM-dependent methyltransferase